MQSQKMRNCLNTTEAQECLEEVAPYFKRLLKQQMSKPTFFLLVFDSSDPNDETKYGDIRRSLQSFRYSAKYLRLVELELTPQQIRLTNSDLFPATVTFRCLALDLGASEKMRDILKERLWKIRVQQNITNKQPEDIEFIKQQLEELASDLAQRGSSGIVQSTTRERYRLRNHGLFVPATARKFKGLRTHSFDHGGGHFYRYRVASKKLSSLPPLLKGIDEYLELLFADCPNHFFKSGPRISALKWPIRPSAATSTDHEIAKMARAAHKKRKYKSPHDNVEVYLLENDSKTIASEVPVWLEPVELKKCAPLFSSSECLTGHIDILRYENEKLGVWDYKPNVSANEQAGLQVFLYAIALSVRTGIPLVHFLCGYFDQRKAYLFSPSNPGLAKV